MQPPRQVLARLPAECRINLTAMKNVVPGDHHRLPEQRVEWFQNLPHLDFGRIRNALVKAEGVHGSYLASSNTEKQEKYKVREEYNREATTKETILDNINEQITHEKEIKREKHLKKQEKEKRDIEQEKMLANIYHRHRASLKRHTF